jgi:hypothetical protein
MGGQARQVVQSAAEARRACFQIPQTEAQQAAFRDHRLGLGVQEEGPSGLVSSYERAANCAYFYQAVSAGAIGLDLGGSVLTGGGALGLVISGGQAAQTTVSAFSAVALAPLVFGEVLGQSPQAALARQANDAVELATCHAVQVRAAVSQFQPAADELAEALAEAQALQREIDLAVVARRDALLAARAEAAEADSTIAAAPVPTLADLITQDPQLAELMRFGRVTQNAILAAEAVQRSLAREQAGAESLDARIARRLDMRLDMINEQWADQFVRLAPTPQRTLRTVLAAPLSASANLISGRDVNADATQAAVEQALYDFSGTRMSYGVERAEAVTVNTNLDMALFDPEQWGVWRARQGVLARVGRAIDSATDRLNDTAALDGRIAGGNCLLESAAASAPAN